VNARVSTSLEIAYSGTSQLLWCIVYVYSDAFDCIPKPHGRPILMANEGVIRLKCESYEREAGLHVGDIHCGLFQPCTEQVEGYWCSQGARPVLRPKRRYRPGLFCLSEVRVLFHCPRSHRSNYSHLRVRWLRDSLFYRGCVAFRHVQRWLHITTLRYQL